MYDQEMMQRIAMSKKLYDQNSSENTGVHRQLSMEDVCSSEERPTRNQEIAVIPNVEMYILDSTSENSCNNISGMQIVLNPSCELKNTFEILKEQK